VTTVTAEWLIPTVVYIFAAGGLGVLSKVALRHIRWPELVMWSGIGYVILGLFLLGIGQTQVEFVTGSVWAGVGTVVIITSLFMFFVALSSGEVGKVVPITAAYPVVTLILAAIFLSEGITVAKAVGVCIVVGGVVVLTTAD
jgi:bacterial/archaeal transporter family protein